ncbi:MAG TPA: hypothetical protein VFD31_08235 [Thermoleophilaceae bacterium]|nr:hypothetical protein [Thermoleophilaceae bacterium]
MSADEQWRVTLPRGAERPFRVFVNGIPQEEGRDYKVRGRELLFDRPLEKERLNLWRWVAIFLALFGTYGKNDSVDVQYQLSGRTTVATGLEITPPRGDASLPRHAD